MGKMHEFRREETRTITVACYPLHVIAEELNDVSVRLSTGYGSQRFRDREGRGCDESKKRYKNK